MSDTDPRDQRQPGRPDRRQGPRREVDRAEWYAREALLAAAVSWTEAIAARGYVDSDDFELHQAIHHWREAVARVQETSR